MAKQFLLSLKQTIVALEDMEVIFTIDVRALPQYEECYNILPNTHFFFQKVNPKVSDVFQTCYENSKGKWVWFLNDDLLSETVGWDLIIKEALENFPDEMILLWPNDMIFGLILSCFPLTSRKAIEAVQYFPIPYHMYKVDDSLFDIFPPERKLYTPSIVMRHLHLQQGGNGYRLPNGMVYPNKEPYMSIDTELFARLAKRREMQRSIIKSFISLDSLPKQP